MVDKIVKVDGTGLYFQEEYQKSVIVLHHTVSNNVEGVLAWWRRRNDKVATAYIVDMDGKVYEVFEPKYWAYHTGIGSEYDKKSIGIELVNEGVLYKKGKYILTTYGRYQREGVYEHNVVWRGYRYFAPYTEAQVRACGELVDYLIGLFGIKRQIYKNLFEYSVEARKFEGVVAHCTIRPDKTDVSVAFPVQMFARYAKIQI